MRILVTLALCGSLAVVGCSDNNDNNTGGSGGSGGSGATGGSGGTAGMGGSGGTAGMGGSGGTAGQGGTGGASAAKAFCEDYDSICGFGGEGYADQGACESAYESFSGPKQDCVELHLGFADDMMDTVTHCPHANGGGPCNL